MSSFGLKELINVPEWKWAWRKFKDTVSPYIKCGLILLFGAVPFVLAFKCPHAVPAACAISVLLIVLTIWRGQ